MSTESAVLPSESWQVNRHMVQARIGSGIVLMVYVTAHLLNHAVGLISLEAVGQAGTIFKTFWRFLPVTIILYTALAVHVIVSLLQLVRRRSLQMPARDWIQVILGLAIPFLMVTHIMGTRYASEIYGITDSYEYVLLSTFVFSPVNGYVNATGLIVTWIHGCIGLHLWLSSKRFYSEQIKFYGLILAVLIPALSLAGYLSAGRESIVLSSDGEWMGGYYERLTLAGDEIWGLIGADTQSARLAVIVVIGSVIVARLLKSLLSRRQGFVTINYQDGPTVTHPKGLSLLEISQVSGIPHASVCGGRGRCSTCRVQIIRGEEDIDAPSAMETRVLERVGAGGDVRLACQWVARKNLDVALLLPPDAGVSANGRPEQWSTGQERVVTVLFADLRDFTKTSESRLPFDVVYLINQFSKEMGQAVEANSGRIDKFLGDGLMAIFGISSTPEDGARQATAAAAAMRGRLSALNERLRGDLDEPLRMGIGIHSGAVVLGSMGYGASRGLTAIGDTVNTASRLEAATKSLECVICVSGATADLADIDLPESTRSKVEVRGKRNTLDVYALSDDDVAGWTTD